jgi:hypothetical protein
LPWRIPDKNPAAKTRNTLKRRPQKIVLEGSWTKLGKTLNNPTPAKAKLTNSKIDRETRGMPIASAILEK